MIEKISGIYCIKNKNNEKMYIGYSSNIYRRFYEHKNNLKNNKHENSYLQKSYNKYGEISFEFFIIESCEENEMKEREIFYIEKYSTFNKDFGYNMTLGGDGIIGMIRDWGDKISLSKKGTKFSSEHIKNLSISHIGYVPTTEQKEKLKISLVGKKKSKNSSSKFVGVSTKGKRWRAYIVIDHKQINLGYYDDEISSAMAYDKKCFDIYGDLSKLNFPENYETRELLND